MAKSSGVKGFWYVKNLSPNVEDPYRMQVTLASGTSAALTIGDAVQWTDGYLTIAGTGELVLGILEGFVTANGQNIFQSAVSVSGTKSGDDTYTPASSGETVLGVVNCDSNGLFYNYADATKAQADIGEAFDTTAGSDQITGSGTDQGDNAGQFLLIELAANDPFTGESTSSYGGLYKIRESQLTTADQAT